MIQLESIKNRVFQIPSKKFNQSNLLGMGFNELNSVEHYIIHQLSGVNLNSEETNEPQAKLSSSMGI